MEMQVKHCLPALGAVIHDKSEAFLDTQLPGDVTYRQHEVSQQGLVISLGVCQFDNGFARDD